MLAAVLVPAVSLVLLAAGIGYALGESSNSRNGLGGWTFKTVWLARRTRCLEREIKVRKRLAYAQQDLERLTR